MLSNFNSSSSNNNSKASKSTRQHQHICPTYKNKHFSLKHSGILCQKLVNLMTAKTNINSNFKSIKTTTIVTSTTTVSKASTTFQIKFLEKIVRSQFILYHNFGAFTPVILLMSYRQNLGPRWLNFSLKNFFHNLRLSPL